MNGRHPEGSAAGMKTAIPRRFKARIAAALALILLTTWVWSPVVHFGFVYDDHAEIETNSHLQSWGTILQEPLWGQLGPRNTSPYYRPLYATLLFMQFSAFGLNPAFWHAVSIALHTLVVLALYVFLLIQFKEILPALAGASLFAV